MKKYLKRRYIISVDSHEKFNTVMEVLYSKGHVFDYFMRINNTSKFQKAFGKAAWYNYIFVGMSSCKRVVFGGHHIGVTEIKLTILSYDKFMEDYV